MKTKISTVEFYNYLKMIIEHHKLEPKNTYVEITWWNNVFRPLITTDCDRSRDSKYIMVFGDTLCNTCGKNDNGEVIPSGFWIYNDAYCVEQVIHRPLTLDKIKVFDAKYLSNFDTVEFLFSNSPVNYCVNINPFRTKIYKNGNGETILSFYVDDIGEWRYISKVKPENIKVISES